MYRAKFQHPHQGQLDLDEFVAEDVLEIQNGNLASNLLVIPGTEKAQADWNELMNGNDQVR